MRTLAALGRLLRRTPPPPDDILEAYAHEVVPVLDRAEWLYQYWLEQSSLFSDSEKLGNVAAIHRWETASMGRSLERVRPPTVLAGAHEDVLDALDMASRAAQLLSSGSRFHNANAVCEGQALLVTARDRRLAALQAMRRYLAAVMDADAAAKAAESQAALGDAAVVAAAVSAAAAAQPAPSDAATQAAAAAAEVFWPTAQPPTDQADADAAELEHHEDAEYDFVHDEHEDDEEDALPWLTRLAAEQPAEPEAPAEPAAPAEPEPSAGGWGSLFRQQPPTAPGTDDSPPP